MRRATSGWGATAPGALAFALGVSASSACTPERAATASSMSTRSPTKHMGYLQRYRIQLMPTQVFFDAEGRETGRHMGKISADEIVARLDGGAR